MSILRAPEPRWITVEEFAANPEWEHFHYLLHGEVKEDMGTAHPLHERTKSRLIRALNRIIGDRVLVYSETAFKVDGYSLMIPDVSVRWPDTPMVADDYPVGSPALAIEVLSPSNTAMEAHDKAQEYWANGAQAVWILDPDICNACEVDIHGNWISSLDLLSVVLKSDTAGELKIELDPKELWEEVPMYKKEGPKQ